MLLTLPESVLVDDTDSELDTEPQRDAVEEPLGEAERVESRLPLLLMLTVLVRDELALTEEQPLLLTEEVEQAD